MNSKLSIVFRLKFRSLNDYDKGRNNKREDPPPQLPKQEIIQFRKEELTSSKNKTKTITNELNLPLLQGRFDY